MCPYRARKCPYRISDVSPMSLYGRPDILGDVSPCPADEFLMPCGAPPGPTGLSERTQSPGRARNVDRARGGDPSTGEGMIRTFGNRRRLRCPVPVNRRISAGDDFSGRAHLNRIRS
jgi:hypothetical protein